MFKLYKDVTPLFIGLAIFGLGIGLHGTLMGVRVVDENYNATLSGMILSAYFLGFIVGSVYVPKLIGLVGHIRVFAALSATISAAVLLFNSFIDPYVWIVLRFFIGISAAGIYIVAETWLNDFATAENRGRLLGVYTFVLMGSITLSQFFLEFMKDNGSNLFILISVLTSLAAIPIALFARKSPHVEQIEIMSLKRLVAHSPLGVTAALLGGVIAATVTSYGAVYVTSLEKSPFEISLYMAFGMAGGALMQWPMGALSDKFGRRIIIFAVSAITLFASYFLFTFGTLSWTIMLIGAFWLGGVGLSLYILSLSLVNDRLERHQMVSAGATMILLEGLGASAGPLITSIAIDSMDASAFYLTGLVSSAILTVLVVYRSIVAPSEGEVAAFPNVISKTSAMSVQLASDVAEDIEHEHEEEAAN